jgi:5,10-methylene-tetrahydrofolate dehydrogenase/methenyl tetrahydrofolate cyclohydrolase
MARAEVSAMGTSLPVVKILSILAQISLSKSTAIVIGRGEIYPFHPVAELLKRWYKVIMIDDPSTRRLENIRLHI